MHVCLLFCCQYKKITGTKKLIKTGQRSILIKIVSFIKWRFLAKRHKFAIMLPVIPVRKKIQNNVAAH